MRKFNLTYKELIKLAPKDRPFQVKVESGDIYWCWTQRDRLLICFMGNNVFYLEDIHKGKLTLIDEYRNMYEKPELLEVGTEVEILKSGANRRYLATWMNIIDEVRYDDYGIYYLINGYSFPHYCVRPVGKVEKVEEKEKEIITVNGKKYKLIN
jgi:hypothetical protein